MRLRSEPEELADTIRAVDTQEERELREVGSMATVSFFEIAILIGSRVPEFDPSWFTNVGIPCAIRMLGVPDSVAASMRTSFIEWLQQDKQRDSPESS